MEIQKVYEGRAARRPGFKFELGSKHRLRELQILDSESSIVYQAEPATSSSWMFAPDCKFQ